MEFSLDFLRIFWLGITFISPLLLLLILLIVLLGFVAARLESWKPLDALYWAFITALTVGYGDIRPTRKISRFLSICIAWIGILCTGLLVALAVQAASKSFEMHVMPDVVQQTVSARQ